MSCPALLPPPERAATQAGGGRCRCSHPGAGAAPQTLLDLLREDGGALLAPDLTRRLVERHLAAPPPDDAVPPALRALTDREREVLAHVARGLSNADIAAELHIGEATVKTHVNHMLSKLGLRDRVQVVVLAYESGLVRPGTR